MLRTLYPAWLLALCSRPLNFWRPLDHPHVQCTPHSLDFGPRTTFEQFIQIRAEYRASFPIHLLLSEAFELTFGS